MSCCVFQLFCYYKWNSNFSGYTERQYITLKYNSAWEVLISLLLCRTRRKLSGPFHPSLPLSSHLFVVSHDAKFLFSGGYWDSSLRVYSLAKSKTVASVRRHFGEWQRFLHCNILGLCGAVCLLFASIALSFLLTLHSNEATLNGSWPCVCHKPY
jgi:hypothetical protein